MHISEMTTQSITSIQKYCIAESRERERERASKSGRVKKEKSISFPCTAQFGEGEGRRYGKNGNIIKNNRIRTHVSRCISAE